MENKSNFISILSDYGFKLTFGNKADTTFLRKALQAIILNERPIEAIEFLSNEFIGITKDARAGLYDLICKDENDNSFIVEMQLGYYPHFIQRSKFYAFHRFNTLVDKGDYKFKNLTPIYCIGFLANNIFPKSKEYFHFGKLRNQKGENMDNQIVHIIIEIDKFDKKLSDLRTDLDKLLYLMKNHEIIEKMKELPEVLSEGWIEKALQKFDKSKMTADQRMHFEMMLARNGSIIEMQEAEGKRIKEEKERAIKAAVEEKEREIEAKEREIKAAVEEKEREIEKIKKQSIINQVKALKAGGVDKAIISNITGLSIEKIEKLLNDD